MKFDLDHTNAKYVIEAYDDYSITVNGSKNSGSLILSPEKPVQAWNRQHVSELNLDDFSALAEISTEILLIGTGAELVFPEYSLLAPLFQAGIGFEIMSTSAACRSYVVLSSEGRKVAAALILQSTNTL